MSPREAEPTVSLHVILGEDSADWSWGHNFCWVLASCQVHYICFCLVLPRVPKGIHIFIHFGIHRIVGWVPRMVLSQFTSSLTFRLSQWHPTPVLLPGKSHGRKSLEGCSPWGREESDMTERLHFHFSLSCIGERMATHSSVLAWRISGMAGPGGLPSIGSHRVRHNWSDLAAAAS